MHAAGCVLLSRWSAAAVACCKHRCVSACPCACFLVGRPTTSYMLSSLMDASLRFFLRWQWKQETEAASSSFTSLPSTNEACCGGCCKVGRCKAFYNSTTVGRRGIRRGGKPSFWHILSLELGWSHISREFWFRTTRGTWVIVLSFLLERAAQKKSFWSPWKKYLLLLLTSLLSAIFFTACLLLVFFVS